MLNLTFAIIVTLIFAGMAVGSFALWRWRAGRSDPLDAAATADDDFTRAIHEFGSIRKEWDRDA